MYRQLPFILLLLLGGAARGQGGDTTGRPALPKSPVSDSLRPVPGSARPLRAITFIGARRTRAAIIRREMALREGSLLHPDSLRYYAHRDSLRLQNSNLFTDVQFQFVPAGAEGYDLYVLLKERWYIWPELGLALADRNFNVWWRERNRDLRRANVMAAIADYNFRGNLEQLRVGGQYGYTRRASVEYRRPYVDRRQQHGIGLTLAYSEAAEQYYTTDSNKLRFVRVGTEPVIREVIAGLGYTYRPGYSARHSAEVRYRDFRIHDTVARLNRDFFKDGSTRLRFLEAFYRYEVNGVDNWNYPLTGRKLVLAGTARWGLEGLRFQAFANVEAGLFQRLGRRWYSSQIFRGRISAPERVPYYLRGALGGATEYVRGYEYYVVDGSQYGVLRGNLKYQAVSANIRNLPFRFLPTIPLAVYPKVFADAGWARARFPGNSYLNDRLLCGYGVGLDFITAYNFKLRLEWSWNGLGEQDVFLHQGAE